MLEKSSDKSSVTNLQKFTRLGNLVAILPFGTLPISHVNLKKAWNNEI